MAHSDTIYNVIIGILPMIQLTPDGQDELVKSYMGMVSQTEAFCHSCDNVPQVYLAQDQCSVTEPVTLAKKKKVKMFICVAAPEMFLHQNLDVPALSFAGKDGCDNLPM